MVSPINNAIEASSWNVTNAAEDAARYAVLDRDANGTAARSATRAQPDGARAGA